MDEQLKGILVQLISPNNISRAEAEQRLANEWANVNPHQLMLSLSTLMKSVPEAELQSLSCVLLRRQAMKSLASSSQEIRAQILENILVSLSQQTTKQQIHILNDTICQVFNHLSTNGRRWEQLVTTLPQLLKSMPVHRESLFMIIAGCPALFTPTNSSDVQPLVGLISQGLVDQEDFVRVAAVKAAIYYAIDASSKHRNAILDLMPQLLNVLPPLKDDLLANAIDYFIELATCFPKHLKPFLSNLLEFMVSVIKNTDFEDRTRQSALELLLTLCEFAPGMMRKQNAGQIMVPRMLEWMSELDDDSDWYTLEQLDDDDNDSNETVGEQGMDRISRYLGKHILPTCFDLIPKLLSSPDWNRRHSGLRCISAIGEGCHDEMLAELGQVVNLVIAHFNDPHPRVRHACCNATGQMCTDFEPLIQQNYSHLILNGLCHVLESDVLRLSVYAAAALVNFTETASKLALEFTPRIIPKLLLLLQSGKLFAQEQAITTLSTVCCEGFQYYSSIAPVLLSIINSINDPTYLALRGKTIECLSLVGLYSGGFEHIHEFVAILTATQTSISEDNVQFGYLMSAWARVGQILKHEFAPLLPICIPPLLKTLISKTEFLAMDEENDMDEEEQDQYEIMSVNGQRVGIRTSILEDRATALDILCLYCADHDMEPFKDDIAKVVKTGITYQLHELIRMNAARLLSVICARPQWRDDPGTNLVVLLLQQMSQEDDMECLSVQFDSLATILEYLPGVFNNDLIEMIKTVCGGVFKREEERLVEKNDEDLGVEDLDLEYDVDLLASISGLFKQLLPMLQTSLTATPAMQLFGISCFIDVLESLNITSHSHVFAEPLKAGLSSPSIELRQTCAYGVKVIARYTESSQWCCSLLPELFAHVDGNSDASDNCVAAIGSILKHINFESHGQVLQKWLSLLPLYNDRQEGLEQYEYLSQLVMAKHPNLDLQTAGLVFAKVLGMGINDSETVVAMGAVWGSLNADQKRQIWEALDERARGEMAVRGFQ